MGVGAAYTLMNETFLGNPKTWDFGLCKTSDVFQSLWFKGSGVANQESVVEVHGRELADVGVHAILSIQHVHLAAGMGCIKTRRVDFEGRDLINFKMLRLMELGWTD